jgi:cyclic-di-AMP phosphodiesterase PgpH
MADTSSKTTFRRNLFTGLFLVSVAALALAALLLPQFLASQSNDLISGQVVDRDILADRGLVFPSQVLTDQDRQAAEAAVSDIYSLPDTAIARRQLERLKNTLAYITSVRKDAYGTVEQKLGDLTALDDIQLSREASETVLSMNEARWLAVEQESITVLEQLMRSPIRPGNIEQAVTSAPSMISLALSPTQASVVTEFVQSFLEPNSFLSEDLTRQAREEARKSVEPVVRSFVAGQTIVRRGELLDPVDIEALVQFGYASPQIGWQDYAAAIALVALMGGFLLLYLRSTPNAMERLRELILISLLLLLFLFTARLTVYGHVVLPYVFPLAGFSLLVSALFGMKVAMIASLPLAVMIAYGMPNALDLSLYYILGSLFGILALGRARRMSVFFWAGAAVALAGWLVILAYRLVVPTMDWVGVLTLFGASLLNGIASAVLAILLQIVLAFFLGTITPMQLMDLTRPDQPLLQIILQQAPGTYQHSLQVANLAEQAAEKIGADGLLTRVGSLYHDAGKAMNPIFFIENQLPGFTNPHEELEPADSARIIISHVTDGVKLARSQRLPRRINDFILEHHGTTMTRYQYAMAVAAAGGNESRVDSHVFRYPGPRPQSRETAILMLADACEARVRAERPQDEDAMFAVIKQTIQQRVAEGELNDTELTLTDLDKIASSFTTTLRGFYHPRIQYPQPGSIQLSESTQKSTGGMLMPGSENPSPAAQDNQPVKIPESSPVSDRSTS